MGNLDSLKTNNELLESSIESVDQKALKDVADFNTMIDKGVVGAREKAQEIMVQNSIGEIYDEIQKKGKDEGENSGIWPRMSLDMKEGLEILAEHETKNGYIEIIDKGVLKTFCESDNGWIEIERDDGILHITEWTNKKPEEQRGRGFENRENEKWLPDGRIHLNKSGKELFSKEVTDPNKQKEILEAVLQAITEEDASQ